MPLRQYGPLDGPKTVAARNHTLHAGERADALVSPFFVLASDVNANLFDLVLIGVDFSNPVWTHSSGVYVSLASLVAIAAIVVAFTTNQPSFSKMQLTEPWIAVATIGLVIAPRRPGLPRSRGRLQGPHRHR